VGTYARARGNVTQKYLLNLGVEPYFIVYPDGGDTKRGMYTLHDLVNAYYLGVPVDITGFPYMKDENGISEQMFHVNYIEVKERELLPLTTKHQWSLIQMKHHEYFEDSTVENFPITFRVGIDEYPEGNGKIEHFYPVYLYKGETVYYSYNSSVSTVFGVFHHYPSIGIRSFDGSHPEDYEIYVDDYNTTGTYTVRKEGYYTFAFRAIDCSEVIFDLFRIE